MKMSIRSVAHSHAASEPSQDTHHGAHETLSGTTATEPDYSADFVSREPIGDIDRADRIRAKMAAQLVGTQRLLGSADPTFSPGGANPAFAGVQAKLRIGRPDDQYEREADRVSDAVTKMPDSKAQRQMDDVMSEDEEPMDGAQAKVQEGTVQREGEDEEPMDGAQAKVQEGMVQREGEDEEPMDGAQAKVQEGTVQREGEDEEPMDGAQAKVQEGTVQREGEDEEPMDGAQAKVQEGTVQREGEGEEDESGSCPGCQRTASGAVSRSEAPGGGLAQDLAQGGSSGRPLDGEQLDYYGSRMKRDFSDVRVHSGPRAEGLARSINAKAFTKGRDIYFGSEHYQLHAESGQRLLAHELAHVVQQGAAGTRKD